MSNEMYSLLCEALATLDDARNEAEGDLKGESDKISGWAHVSAYRRRECYKGVGEFSIYIHKDYRGRGIGRQLLGALLDECEKLHYWKLLSRIFDFNTGSRKLCRSLGFHEVGIYEKHSQLNGRWIDCVIVKKLFPQ